MGDFAKFMETAFGYQRVTMQNQPRLHRVLMTEFMQRFDPGAKQTDRDLFYPNHIEDTPANMETSLKRLSDTEFEIFCNGNDDEVSDLYEEYWGLETVDGRIGSIIYEWSDGPPLWARDYCTLGELTDAFSEELNERYKKSLVRVEQSADGEIVFRVKLVEQEP